MFKFERFISSFDTIDLVLENHDKMAKCYNTPIYSNGFDHANLVSSFHASTYFPKFD